MLIIKLIDNRYLLYRDNMAEENTVIEDTGIKNNDVRTWPIGIDTQYESKHIVNVLTAKVKEKNLKYQTAFYNDFVDEFIIDVKPEIHHVSATLGDHIAEKTGNILLKNDNILYHNAKGQSISLCQPISQEASTGPGDQQSYPKQFTELLLPHVRHLKHWNDTHEEDQQSDNHVILFAYHLKYSEKAQHWVSAALNINLKTNQAVIKIYDSLNSPDKPKDTTSINEEITSKIHQELKKIYPEIELENTPNHAIIKQQFDTTSCGAISAENLLKALDDEATLIDALKKVYPEGCKDLRRHHQEQIREGLLNNKAESQIISQGNIRTLDLLKQLNDYNNFEYSQKTIKLFKEIETAAPELRDMLQNEEVQKFYSNLNDDKFNEIYEDFRKIASRKEKIEEKWKKEVIEAIKENRKIELDLSETSILFHSEEGTSAEESAAFKKAFSIYIAVNLGELKEALIDNTSLTKIDLSGKNLMNGLDNAGRKSRIESIKQLLKEAAKLETLVEFDLSNNGFTEIEEKDLVSSLGENSKLFKITDESHNQPVGLPVDSPVNSPVNLPVDSPVGLPDKPEEKGSLNKKIVTIIVAICVALIGSTLTAYYWNNIKNLLSGLVSKFNNGNDKISIIPNPTSLPSTPFTPNLMSDLRTNIGQKIR